MNITIYKNLFLRLNVKYFCSTFLLILLSQSVKAQLFEEISQSIGINHFQETTNNTGGGVAIFDYDLDGYEDVYLTGGFDVDKLYHNNGDGTFSDMTQQAGISLTGNVYTTVAITGDIDNDGDRDIFIGTTTEILGGDFRNLLMQNNGNGTFSEIGFGSGIDNETDETVGATFLDYDQDGFLDIYVINYVERGHVTVDSAGMVTGFAHECFNNYFYHNNGDGTFTERGADLGLENTGCSLAVTATDYDMDADLDIYLANDFGEFVYPNAMFENQLGEADTFVDVASSIGLDVGLYGMGIATGDYDQDGDFDYYVTNLGRNVLLDNDGTGQFSDVATFAQVENTWVIEDSLLTTSWGTAFLDYDNDTYLDLFVTNGQIPAAEFIATGALDPNKLYRNNGDKTFEDISEIAGIDDTSRGRGMAHFDFDHDGDLDIIVSVLSTSTGEIWTKFYKNNTVNNNNWLKVKLTGTTCNKDAFGSKIKLYTAGKMLIREIDGGSSHASQHSNIAHFGLGANTATVDSLVIEWLGGDREVFYTIPSNQTLDITQGGGQNSMPVVVTFQVDMTTAEVAPGGISMAADFENWAGSIVLEDADGDGVFSTTQTLAAGEYQYRFINGFSSSFSNWEQLEADVHADCTVTENSTTNRSVEVGTEDLVIDVVCYESCSECMVEPDTIFVTFQVDIRQNGSGADGVFLGGNFENWQGSIALEDSDGDGIFTTTQPILEGEILYRFIDGSPEDFNNWEMFDAEEDSSCTIEQNGFLHRVTNITADIVLDAVCLNSCDICIPDAVFNVVDPKLLFTISPTLTKDKVRLVFPSDLNDRKQIFIYNTMGSLVEKIEVNAIQLQQDMNLSHLAAGLYLVQVRVGQQIGNERIVVMK